MDTSCWSWRFLAFQDKFYTIHAVRFVLSFEASPANQAKLFFVIIKKWSCNKKQINANPVNIFIRVRFSIQCPSMHLYLWKGSVLSYQNGRSRTASASTSNSSSSSFSSWFSSSVIKKIKHWRISLILKLANRWNVNKASQMVI